MTADLSRERLGQLVLAVEALRAGDSSLRTAKHVHHALMLDPQWAAVTYRQARRAVTKANARQPQLSGEQKRARRQQQERKREQQRPHRHRERAGRSRPAEDRAARERAVHSIEVVDDGYICQGQWDPHVQPFPTTWTTASSALMTTRRAMKSSRCRACAQPATRVIGRA